jgi:MFS family permease
MKTPRALVNFPTSRPFLRLWGANAVSAIGDALTTMIVIIWVYDTTGRQASWVSGVIIAGFLPPILVGFLLGGLADRFDRRRLMVTTDVVRTGLALIIVACIHQGWVLPVLFCLAVVTGAGTLFSAAQRAVLRHAVPAEQLTRANGLMSTARQLSFVIGPAIAGLLLLAVNPAVGVAIDAGTFVVSALLLSRLWAGAQEPPPPAQKAGPSGRRRSPLAAAVTIRPAARAILASRPLLLATIAATLLATTAGVNNTVMVLFLDQDLGGRPTDVAWLSSANGMAQVVAGLTVVVLASRLHAGRLLGGSAVVVAAFGLALAFSPALPFAIGAVAGFALANAPFNIAYTTIRQTNSDDAVLGRVFAFTGALASVTFLAGSLGGALLADRTTGRVSLIAGAGCLAVAAAAAFPLLRRAPLGDTGNGSDMQTDDVAAARVRS